jgi:hypothetical protein
MDKPLISEAKANAITTLRPVGLKRPAGDVEDFIVSIPFWDVWCDYKSQAEIT